jgi:hypothetical protein
MTMWKLLLTRMLPTRLPLGVAPALPCTPPDLGFDTLQQSAL